MLLLKTFPILLFLSFQHLLTAQVLSSASPEEVGMSSERLDRLTKTFEKYVDEGELSGSVVLVARKGKIPYFKAFGESNIATDQAMDQQTIFRIASQTKAIISTGIMMLQEEGKLLISEPVGNYIPEFQKTTVAIPLEGGGYGVVPAKRAITIRDLLTHAAGIDYGGGPASELWAEAGIQGWYFAHREEAILETVKRMAKLPQAAQPGEKFVYGYSTDILGALIEVVSGEPLDVFLQKHLLDPLGMNDTHFYLPSGKKDRLAVVYSASESGLALAPNPGGMVGQGAYVEGPRKSFSGGAGFLSTADDYAAFLQMMLNQGTYNGHQFLSPKSVELMTVDHLGDVTFPWSPGTGFGLGFSVVDDLGERGVLGSEGEFGWGGAYHSSYWVDPEEELVVVYFTQLIPAGDIDDHQKLRSLIYQAIVD